MQYKQGLEDIKLLCAQNLCGFVVEKDLTEKMSKYKGQQGERNIEWWLSGGKPEKQSAHDRNLLEWYSSAVATSEARMTEEERETMHRRKRGSAIDYFPRSLADWIIINARAMTPSCRKLSGYDSGHLESYFLQIKPCIDTPKIQHNSIEDPVFMSENIVVEREHETIEEIKEKSRSLLKENKELSRQCFSLRSELKRKEQTLYNEREENIKLTCAAKKISKFHDFQDYYDRESELQILQSDRNLLGFGFDGNEDY